MAITQVSGDAVNLVDPLNVRNEHAQVTYEAPSFNDPTANLKAPTIDKSAAKFGGDTNFYRGALREQLVTPTPQSQAAAGAQIHGFAGAQIDLAQQAAWADRQGGMADELQRRMMGQGPSVAQLQLQQGQQAALQQARAMAASNPSANPAQAMRMQQQAAENINTQTNQQAAMLRANEMQQAAGLLAGTVAGARGQDIGLATSQAGLRQGAGLQTQALEAQGAMQRAGFQQQTNLANQEAELRRNQLVQQLLAT